MTKREVIDAKIMFLKALYDFREKSDGIASGVVQINAMLQKFKECRLLEDVALTDARVILNNKLVAIFNTFNHYDTDMLFFKNADDSLNYSKFFQNDILGYYLSILAHIFGILSSLLDKMEELNQNVPAFLNRNKLNAYLSIAGGEKYYSGSQAILKNIQEIEDLVKNYNELLNKYYDFDFSKDYPIVCAAKLDGIKKSTNPLKDEIASNISKYYLIDYNFCRRFKCESSLPIIKRLYHLFCLELGLDDGFLDTVPDQQCFTQKQEIINPNKYLNMATLDINMHIFEAEKEIISELAKENSSFESIAKLCREFGINLQLGQQETLPDAGVMSNKM